MKLKLQNDACLVREVPAGLSRTGFFFTGQIVFDILIFIALRRQDEECLAGYGESRPSDAGAANL